ncbi:hypothetical protein AGMMS50268_08290 [Spirochaetia bacterium]|nr:hypothetical protein AGMMS50268_08290 [Spirochaetia bacterium]
MKRQCVLLSLVLLAVSLCTMGCVTYEGGINVEPEFKDYVSMRVTNINNPAQLSDALKLIGGTGEIRTIVMGSDKVFMTPNYIVYGPRDPNFIPTTLFYESTVELTPDERVAKQKELGVIEFVEVTTATKADAAGKTITSYLYYGKIDPNFIPEIPAE